MMKKIYNWFFSHKKLWCLTAGMIYSLAFFNGYLFAFGFIGLIMLFMCITPNTKKIFGKIFCFSVGFYIPLYTWFRALYPFDGFKMTALEGIFVVIAAIIGIGLYHSLMNSAVFMLLKLLPKDNRLFPFSAGCVLMISEFVMGLGSFSMPWGTVASSQYRFLPFVMNASLFGSYFVAFLMGFIASSVAFLIFNRNKENIIRAVGSFLVPIVIGSCIMIIPGGEDNNTKIKAAVVQGNVLSMQKWDAKKKNEIIETHLSLAEEAASNGAELIVFAETAVPMTFTSSISAKFSQIAEKYGTTIIMGSITQEGSERFNSVFALYPDSTTSKPYHKQHLVPFGEYIPMKSFLESVFPFIKDLNLGSTDYVSDDEHNAIVTELKNGVKIGNLICFDSIFPSLTRKTVKNGAELIAVSTNDSWFKDSSGVYEHMSHSVIRAIESGRWIIRSANTGISCFISPKGEIYEQTEPLTECVAYHDVYPISKRTLYSYIGDIILILPIGLIIYQILANCKMHRTRKTGKA